MRLPRDAMAPGIPNALLEGDRLRHRARLADDRNLQASQPQSVISPPRCNGSAHRVTWRPVPCSGGLEGFRHRPVVCLPAPTSLDESDVLTNLGLPRFTGRFLGDPPRRISLIFAPNFGLTNWSDLQRYLMTMFRRLLLSRMSFAWIGPMPHVPLLMKS